MQTERNTDGSHISFILDHYDVKAFTTSRYLSHDRSVVSRFRNLLVKAIHEEILLLKAIVLVPEDDIIRNIQYEGPDVIEAYKRIVQWISKEIHRVILAYKDIMPNKARRYRYPAVIWVVPPTNVNFFNNDLRRDFGLALESAASKYSEFWALQLKKVWETDNPNYYDDNGQRFTAKGKKKYWEAVDSTVKFWSTTLDHKAIRFEERSGNGKVSKFHGKANAWSRNRSDHFSRRERDERSQNDKYHWSSKKSSRY